MKYLTMTGFTVRTGSDRWTLGYEGENNSRTLQVKTTDDLTDFATVNLLINTLDCGAMTVTTVGNYKVLSMVLTAGMLGEAGKKTCQLLMMDSEGTVIKKSNQFQMVVGMSNAIEGTVPDSERIVIITDYIEEKVGELLGDIDDTVELLTEEMEELQGDVDHLKNGEVAIDGILIQGFYPVATGTISSASSSARTVVFPVESDKTYYVSWLEGTNKYRVAFGDTPADQIVNGTVIFDYVDANNLSHDHLMMHNSAHSYMYVYIGNTASATIDTVSVVRKIPSPIDDCLSEDNATW